MFWLLFWLLFRLCLPVQAHVRLAEVPSTTRRSSQLFPQQQWQARNASTARPIEQTMQLELINLTRAELYCEAQDFVHSFEEVKGGALHVNRFERTRSGEFASMRDLCLDPKGLPVRRLCKVINATTASWSQLQSVTCRAGNELSQRVNRLREELLGAEQSHKPVVLTKLSQLLSQAGRHGQLAPVDVYSTAQIVSSLVEEGQQVNATLSAELIVICRQIMSADAKVLQLSAQLNATNSLLSKFEQYMDALPEQLVPRAGCGKLISEATAHGTAVERVNLAARGVQALISHNLSVFYVNPLCEHISGIAIYSAPAPDRQHSVNGFWYRLLHANESVQQLQQESSLETASFVPENLWQHLQHKGASYLVLKIYAHAALFVETSAMHKRRPRGPVLSITIPGVESKCSQCIFKQCMPIPTHDPLPASNLPAAVPFLLRQPDFLRADAGCGYWNYETWLNTGVTTSNESSDSPVVLCQAQHLTQFSFLIGGSYAQWQSEELAPHEQLLDVVTLVGCGLSLFGLLGIFLTAALVKKWRDQTSTKVLLHLCLALALQLLLFGFLSQGELSLQENWNRCLLSGAALQYSVLVIFSWMLIIACLQFQRYVTVIGVARPQHYILLSALVAWLLPLLPTLSVVLLNPESYKPAEHQLNTRSALCYPSGYGLAWGVVLPIALVTIANCGMLLCIVYSIYRALNPRRQLIVQQLRLSVLLFFLLGLTWIFGLCSYLHLGIEFSYLFCLTATLQGFVLFVYFVLLNTLNRRAWLTLICPAHMRMDAPRRTTELRSMSTSSTSIAKRT